MQICIYKLYIHHRNDLCRKIFKYWFLKEKINVYKDIHIHTYNEYTYIVYITRQK